MDATPFKRSIGLVFVALYLLVGMAVATYAYSRDLRTFVCDDATAPHGYITHFRTSYKNPDPEICQRRGFTAKSVASIPVLVVIGPILALRWVPGMLRRM